MAVQRKKGLVMRISGYQPLTLSDYPGHVAAIVFTQGCNMACPFCHNGRLIPCHPGELDEETIRHALQQRRHRLQGVVVTGGEPTLQPDLPEFCAWVQGIGLKVKLDTNGSRPAVLASLIHDRLVDYLAMDIKAPLNDPAQHRRLTASAIDPAVIRQSMELIAASGLPHHFRTTHVPALHHAGAMSAIVEDLPAGSKHVMQVFQSANALDASLRS